MLTTILDGWGAGWVGGLVGGWLRKAGNKAKAQQSWGLGFTELGKNWYRKVSNCFTHAAQSNLILRRHKGFMTKVLCVPKALLSTIFLMDKKTK